VQISTKPLAISLVAQSHPTMEETTGTMDRQEEEGTRQQGDPLTGHQHRQWEQMQVHKARSETHGGTTPAILR
jgi:hypothetical protein